MMEKPLHKIGDIVVININDVVLQAQIIGALYIEKGYWSYDGDIGDAQISTLSSRAYGCGKRALSFTDANIINYNHD